MTRILIKFTLGLLYFIAKKLSDMKKMEGKNGKKNKKKNCKREKGNFLFFFIKNIYYNYIFSTVFLYCDIYIIIIIII